MVTVVLGALLAGALVAVVALLIRWRALARTVDRLDTELAAQATAAVEAERAAARLAASLEAMDQGVVIFGDGEVSVHHNAAAAVYLDARHGDALVEEAIVDLVGTVEPGETRSVELEVYGPPARTLVLRAVSLAKQAAGSGSLPSAGLSGVLVVVEDLTERRRLENVRRDFVANVSHELKTPVGALALLAETLTGEDDPEVMARLGERMLAEAFRVARTIEDLLELSQLEGDQQQLYQELPVATVVREAVERVGQAAEGRDIALRVTEPSADLVVRGERRQLVSAVANLLDNAIKYSDPGSPVELGARRDGRWVDVEVRDYGIGIPRRDRERIFERFYRVDRARSRETGGTGLGLAIVRHVASNHRGLILVDSREGEGSRFTLRLLPGGGDGDSDAAAEADGRDTGPSSVKETR